MQSRFITAAFLISATWSAWSAQPSGPAREPTFAVSVPSGLNPAGPIDGRLIAQERLEALQPAYGGEVLYGDRAEHCWNGDPRLPNAYSRLHYNAQYVPKILQRIAATAPAGADLNSWRY
jgi:hypothetical protein